MARSMADRSYARGAMWVFVLILLLLAAVFGILGAVLKAVAFLVLTAILTITVLGALAWWGLKRSARQFQREYQRQMAEGEPTYRPNEASGDDELPGRDDRY
jgi:uncharacterized protein (DUF58 family)